jgi:DUF4097 and DUF4098 domain-containing protein YvlB
MPTYDTPRPISVTVELAVGELTVDATDRTDTVVEVRPTNPERKADVAAAEQTVVEYAAGHLLVRAPRRWKQYSPFGAGDESVTVTLAVPIGSALEFGAAAGTVRTTGRLGQVSHHSGAGEVRLDQTGPLRVKTGAGDVTVARAVGDVEVSTGTGAVRLAAVDGTVVVKNSNGDTWMGTVTGDSRVSSANGRITVEHAHRGMSAKSANGDIRLAEVRRGAISATTAAGRVDVGILDGVAAWLDLDTKFGAVRSELDATERPETTDDGTVEVTARSSFGDVIVRRAYADPVEDAS